MSDQPQETREQAVVREGLEAFTRVHQERDHYKGQCDVWERSNAMVENENQMLRNQVRELEHRAAFYMRYSTELLTKLQTLRPHADVFGQVIDETLRAAKEAAYRPTNEAPAMTQPQLGSSPPDDGEPVPTFLTKLEGEIAPKKDITDTGKDKKK